MVTTTIISVTFLAVVVHVDEREELHVLKLAPNRATTGRTTSSVGSVSRRPLLNSEKQEQHTEEKQQQHHSPPKLERLQLFSELKLQRKKQGLSEEMIKQRDEFLRKKFQEMQLRDRLKKLPAWDASDNTAIPRFLSNSCDVKENKLHRAESADFCIKGRLPAFSHRPPLFLDRTNHEAIFLVQPENVAALQSNFSTFEWKSCAAIPSRSDSLAGRIDAPQVWSFQHFHDIGLNAVVQFRQMVDRIQEAIEPCKLPVYLQYDKPRGAIILHEEWSLLGFPTNRSTLPRNESSAIRVLTSSEASLHPTHVEMLRSLFPPDPPLNATKIVWISRQGSSMNRRQIANEPDVLRQLQAKIPGLVVFSPMLDKIHSVGDLRNTLGDACLLMGIHGGQMYNQFFAGSTTTVLEFLPVTSQLLYHGQKSADSRPSIAHRAIWFNSNLIMQPYWRLYFEAEGSSNFVLSRHFVDQILEVVSSANCK